MCCLQLVFLIGFSIQQCCFVNVAEGKFHKYRQTNISRAKHSQQQQNKIR